MGGIGGSIDRKLAQTKTKVGAAGRRSQLAPPDRAGASDLRPGSDRSSAWCRASRHHHRGRPCRAPLAGALVEAHLLTTEWRHTGATHLGLA
jgi:hypothetical protein